MRSASSTRNRRAVALTTVTALAAAVLSIPSPAASDAASPLPTPESAFGWKPCTDYQLANYDQITD